MKHAALIVMLAMVGFAIALVTFIAGRLSAEEVALLAGVLCGIGVAVPLGVAAGAAIATHRQARISPALPAIYITQPARPAVVGAQPLQSRLLQPDVTTPAVRPLNIIGQTGFDPEQ